MDKGIMIIVIAGLAAVIAMAILLMQEERPPAAQACMTAADCKGDITLLCDGARWVCDSGECRQTCEPYPPNTPLDVMKTCNTASDCVPVGCRCTCSGCGFSYEDIVNVEYADEWYAINGCSEPDVCPEVCCRGETAVCESGSCAVKLESCGDGVCEGFDTAENCPEDCGTYRCANFTRDGTVVEKCATCGNGICEDGERCTPSAISDNMATSDCGGLYCPEDCNNLLE
jgi:hypothetical protein